MQRNPTPTPPEQLYPRRLAARALALVLDSYGLTAVALRFNPDDARECLPGLEEGEVIFGEDIVRRWSPLATVFVHGTSARVIVEEVEALIRSNHRRDFEGPESVGIFPRPGCPDIDVTVDIAEVIQRDGELLRTTPQRLSHPASRPLHIPQVLGRSDGGRR